MKEYPRIYSLSTLGIKHHQENDYILHPARTDFIGDSGSGKSIIADLLQLIFVGSSAFRSATITVKEKREPDGLVLRTPGNSIDYGYAFVNIEVSEGQFITAGVYLESISKSTRSFIIQASLAIEQGDFIPMPKPLYASDFQSEKYVFPLDEMTEQMEERGLVFKDWQRISYFHKILYRNKILPLDLADKDKVLKDYAKIIQSFSRGEELDTTKSSSLLDFLFGQEKGKELVRKYQSIVEEIEKNAMDYGKNNDQIILLTKKCLKVSDLYKVLQEKKEAEKEFRTYEYVYQHRAYVSDKKNIEEELRTFLQAKKDLLKLQELGRHDLEEAERGFGKKKTAYEIALDDYDGWRQKKALLNRAIRMVEQLNISQEELASYYQQYRRRKKDYACYKELLDKLTDSRMIDLFSNSGWKDGMKTGSDFYHKRTDELRDRLSQLEVVGRFHDINNPDSLAGWVLSTQRRLTEEEESLIFHFQKYGMNKPNEWKATDRYVYSPEELLSNKSIDPDGEGFWINLGGVREFVENVEKPCLNSEREVILQYFQSRVENIEQEKTMVEEELKIWDRLFDIVNALELPAQSLNAFFHQPEINNFQEIAVLNISPEEMKQYVDSLTEKDSIEVSEKRAKEEQSSLLTQVTQAENMVKKFPSLIQKTENILTSISTKIQLQEVEWNSFLPKDFLEEYTEGDYLDAEDKIEFFQNELTYLGTTLDKCDELMQSVMDFKELESSLKAITSNYVSLYTDLPAIDSIPTVSKESVGNMKELYIQKEANYSTRYILTVKEFLPDEQYKFETSHDFKELIAHLLPDLFPEEMIIEDEVVSRIKKRLEDINEKNRELNSKKIGKIQELLIEVKRQVEAQWDEIRRINRFFTSGSKKISGIYNMKLERVNSLQFPVSWLSQFKHKASLDNMADIFEGTILNSLNTQVSIREKIMLAFQEITNISSNDITLEELLNPNSYIELSLDMTSQTGRKNKGSTGQTYAAIALLCIARLSIVGNKNKGQEKGLRFMPIDEAEGLGSNFDLLSEIAATHDYQILTFSINPLGRYNEQHVYILNLDSDAEEGINYTPIEIRNRNDIDSELVKFIDVDDAGG